ncbi:MAG: hypothetical protein L0Y57_07375 [Beijerinckiaceae bacterium]|nr:hypothetical protein [Beijerinckiaceae bacterium]
MRADEAASGSKPDTGTSSSWTRPHFPVPLSSRLDRLQFGPAEKFLLIEQIQIGFGGQISRRLLGLKLALALERKAVFTEEGDPPYLQTLEPQSAHVPDADWSLAEIFDPLLQQSARFLRFEYVAASARLKGSGGVTEWASQRVAEKYSLAAGANIDGEVLKWMRWLPALQAKIEARRALLGVTANTLGVHWRRGDKTVETAYVPASKFNAAIARIYQSWQFDSIFLASDSAEAIEEISVPPGVRLIFDRDEKRYNNANHKMLFRSPELAGQETYTAAKNLCLLSACGGLAGQDNAHFATLASAIIASNYPDPARIILLDGRLAESESPLLGRYFELKRKAREIIRSCIPKRLRMRLLQLKLF